MRRRETWQRQAARGLVVTAAVFWFWYGASMAQIAEEGLWRSLGRILAPEALLALTSLAARHSPLIGGGLFVLESLGVLACAVWSCVRGSISATRLEVVAATLSFPLLGAACFWLFLWTRERAHTREATRHG